MRTAGGLPSLHFRGLWELVGFVETGESEPLIKEEALLRYSPTWAPQAFGCLREATEPHFSGEFPYLRVL